MARACARRSPLAGNNRGGPLAARSAPWRQAPTLDWMPRQRRGAASSGAHDALALRERYRRLPPLSVGHHHRRRRRRPPVRTRATTHAHIRSRGDRQREDVHEPVLRDRRGGGGAVERAQGRGRGAREGRQRRGGGGDGERGGGSGQGAQRRAAARTAAAAAARTANTRRSSRARAVCSWRRGCVCHSLGSPASACMHACCQVAPNPTHPPVISPASTRLAVAHPHHLCV